MAAYDALTSSAGKLTAPGQAVLAQFSWSVERTSFRLSGEGAYLVSQGNLELEAHYLGSGSVPSLFNEASDTRIIALPNAAYVIWPALGTTWVRFTPQESGPDWAAARRLVTAHSPVDYSMVTRAMKDTATAMGSDPIMGQPYDHFRGQSDTNALMAAMADIYGNWGQIAFVDRFTGFVGTEIWIDPQTSLPRRLRAEGNISYLNADTRLTVTVEFTDYHPAANVTAPADYITLSQPSASY